MPFKLFHLLLAVFLLIPLAGGCKRQPSAEVIDDLELPEAKSELPTATATPAPELPPPNATIVNTHDPWGDLQKWILLEGWEKVLEGSKECRLIWAISDRSVFRFWIDKPEKGGKLVVIAWPVETKKKLPQKIQISVNDKPAPELVLRKDGVAQEVPLTPDLLVKGENRFTFKYSLTVVPKEDGSGPDERHLSAAFRMIAFVPNK